jgi:hypothetical protein
MDSKEIWRNIDEVKCKFTRYEVSNLGRVRSVRMVDGADFHYRILTTEKEKRSGPDSASRIRLRTNGKNKKFNVAYLVAKAFIPNPENLPFVCHANGDCTDDRVENLIWSAKRYIAKAEQGKGRESFDFYLKGDNRPLACGVMALSGLWAVKRWERAMRNIVDFERTYGVLTTKNNRAYLNGVEIEIKKTDKTTNDYGKEE